MSRPIQSRATWRANSGYAFSGLDKGRAYSLKASLARTGISKGTGPALCRVKGRAPRGANGSLHRLSYHCTQTAFTSVPGVEKISGGSAACAKSPAAAKIGQGAMVKFDLQGPTDGQLRRLLEVEDNHGKLD